MQEIMNTVAKADTFLTVQHPAVVAHLFQFGQYQFGHHVVRNQHVFLYVALHQQPGL